MHEYRNMARCLVDQMIDEGYAVGEIRWVIPQMEAYLDRLINKAKQPAVKGEYNGKETEKF